MPSLYRHQSEVSSAMSEDQKEVFVRKLVGCHSILIYTVLVRNAPGDTRFEERRPKDASRQNERLKVYSELDFCSPSYYRCFERRPTQSDQEETEDEIEIERQQ